MPSLNEITLQMRLQKYIPEPTVYRTGVSTDVYKWTYETN